MCTMSKTRAGFTPTDHLSKKTESSVVQEHALGLTRYCGHFATRIVFAKEPSLESRKINSTHLSCPAPNKLLLLRQAAGYGKWLGGFPADEASHLTIS